MDFDDFVNEIRRCGPVWEADRIAALESQLDRYRWRRVEEEMPAERGPALIRVDGLTQHWTFLAFYHGDGVWWAEGHPKEPTHWMPLPPAPEEGE